MPTNMRATPTTTPRYALMEEQLLKETWTPYTWSFANSKCGGGMWVPRSSFHFNPYLAFELLLVPASCSIYKIQKKMRGVAMVTILSSHQQNTMVSTLSVLLLTLNKALLGGRPRITMFVLLLISHWIKLNYASCFLLRIPKNFSCTSSACRQPASGNERVIHSWFGHALACPRI